jgi:hypothetical protein
MAETKQSPAKKLGKVMALTNHAPASSAVFVGATTALLLAIAKQKFGVDLTGLEGYISVVVGGLAAYLTGGSQS